MRTVPLRLYLAPATPTLVPADYDAAPAAPPATPAPEPAAPELDDDATIPLAPPAPSPPRPAPRPAPRPPPAVNHGRPRDETPAPAGPAADTRDSPCARRLGKFTVAIAMNNQAMQLRVPFPWDATVGALQEEMLKRVKKKGLTAESCALFVKGASLDEDDTLEEAVEASEQSSIQAVLLGTR